MSFLKIWGTPIMTDFQNGTFLSEFCDIWFLLSLITFDLHGINWFCKKHRLLFMEEIDPIKNFFFKFHNGGIFLKWLIFPLVFIVICMIFICMSYGLNRNLFHLHFEFLFRFHSNAEIRMKNWVRFNVNLIWFDRVFWYLIFKWIGTYE